MSYEILWPERRILSDQQIKQMFDDAVANNELYYDDKDYGTPAEDDYDSMARELDSAGLITLKKKPLL